jgi:hypothetical protein
MPARRRYKNKSGRGGVREYEVARSHILLWFGSDPATCRYDETKPGRRHVEAMKRLAEKGEGLTTYVNQHVRGNYARKSST